MTTEVQGVAGEQLRSIIERIERQQEEKDIISDGIREIYSEAKSHGFDVKTIRELVKLRKMRPADRVERSELLDLYMSAVGMS